jgi:thiamine kinase-like enzyme
VLSQTERIASIPGEFVLRHNLSKSAISEVFLCTLNNLDAVIRLDSMCANRLAIDRENEFMLLKNIQYLDIAPKALYVDPTNGISIWEYVQGKEVTFHPADTKQSIRSLGKSLRVIHSIAIPEHSADIFSNSMNLYHDLLEHTSDAYLFNKASNLYNELLKDDVSKVLSHNDLHKKNILWNDEFYFLDWEYAGINHPCFDIASLVRSFQLSEKEVHELSIGYSFNTKLFNKEKLNQWIEFIAYLDEIWELSIIKISLNLKN